MKRRLINLRLPPALIDRADAEANRLGQTRTKFIERALESALGDSASVLDTAPGVPGSTRTPDEPVAEVLGSKVRKTPSLKDTWGR